MHAPINSQPTAANPYQRLHNFIYGLTIICLIAQVLEGTLVVPYVLLYFGFPQLSVSEICDEMYKIVYDDETRTCEYPYPLFSYEPEPWSQANKENKYGYVTPPAPNYDMPKFREVIERRDKRNEGQRLTKTAGGGL